MRPVKGRGLRGFTERSPSYRGGEPHTAPQKNYSPEEGVEDIT